MAVNQGFFSMAQTCPECRGSGRLIPTPWPTGKTFRVQGKGAPKKGGHGDLLARVVVDVPGKLTKEQKKLVEQLQEATDASPRRPLGVS